MVDISRLFESRRARRKRIARNVAIATGATVALAAGTWWAVRRYLRDDRKPGSASPSGSRAGDGDRAPSQPTTRREREKPATPASGAGRT